MRQLTLLFLLLMAACNSATVPKSADGFVSAPGDVRLYYRTVGSGTPIVVIHGGPGMDHGSLANDLTPLAKSHRLIFYDQRGGGRSTLPAETNLLTIDYYVKDLEAIREHFGLERLTIVAHSFGPAVAALYAIAHPDRVDRMILIGAIPPRRATFFEDYGAALRSRLSPADLARMEELEKSFESGKDLTAVCREYWALATPPRVARSKSASLVKSDLCTAPPESIRYGMTKTNPVTFGSLGDWDWRPQLANVMSPVLIIHGEEDNIPMALVQEWSEALPNAKLLRVAEAGHFPHAERPEIVFPAIEAFLRGASSQ